MHVLQETVPTFAALTPPLLHLIDTACSLGAGERGLEAPPLEGKISGPSAGVRTPSCSEAMPTAGCPIQDTLRRVRVNQGVEQASEAQLVSELVVRLSASIVLGTTPKPEHTEDSDTASEGSERPAEAAIGGGLLGYKQRTDLDVGLDGIQKDEGAQPATPGGCAEQEIGVPGSSMPCALPMDTCLVHLFLQRLCWRVICMLLRITV